MKALPGNVSDAEKQYQRLLLDFMTTNDDEETGFLGSPWIFGTMAALNPLTQKYFLLDFFCSSLRGVGQVVFMNNPLSGLLIIVGMFVQSVPFAVYGLVALVVANAAALALGLDHGLFNSGLFGFNSYLVGLCFATFHEPDLWQDGRLLFPVALLAVFSVPFCCPW